jgi:HlyD family type I secretion membrane fusion protein
MLRLPSLIRPAPRDLLVGPISAFESETQAVLVRTSPYSEHAIFHALVAMVVLSLVLMSVVKLDRVVASGGQLVPTRGTLLIQPFDRAIVRQIKVHQGDIVKAGQVLAELDPTFAQADVTQLRDHLAAASALVARLEAELAAAPYRGGPASAEQLQEAIWRQRQSELEQTLADFDARIRSDESTITRAQQDLQAYSQRLSYATQYTAMQETLEKDGNTSKVKVLSAHDAQAEAGRQVTESRNVLAGAQHDLEALRAQRAVAVGKWRDDIGTQLATARDDLNQTKQSLAKASRISDLITLQAPEDAVVLDVGTASLGSVVDPSSMAVKPLFTLVPLNGPIEAEIDVDSRDVGFVRVGDPVQIKLDAYNFLRHGTAKGEIATISEGAFTEDNNQPRSPFFKARVRLQDIALHDVPKDFRLIPGMTLQGDVLVGHRTIMSYIVTGMMRASSEAMREPE